MQDNGPAGIRTGLEAPKKEAEKSVVKFKVDNKTEKEYIFFRFTNNKTKVGQRRIEKIFKDLLEVTGRIISRDSILKFRNWYMTKYSHYETRKKYYTTTKNFLEWLYKKTGDYRFRELKGLLVTPKRPSKKINSIHLKEDDVRNVISAIYRLPINPHDSKRRHYYSKIKFIAFVLLASYTGQRPEATLVKLTYDDIQQALQRDPPMLWIPEEKDKESFPHWVPLHPVVVEWLEPVIEFYDLHPQGPSDNRLFNRYTVYKMLKKIDVRAIHTGIPIRPSHFRKFFEQMCNNVLMVHPGLRDYIMAHNTRSLNVQSYDGKLPTEIYQQYMETWGDVNLMPPEVKLEELIKPSVNTTVDSATFSNRLCIP